MASVQENVQVSGKSSPSNGEKSAQACAESKNAPPTSSRLPDWVLINLRSPRSLKLLLRCWMASWASYIIILPRRSLTELGARCVFSLYLKFSYIPSQWLLCIASKHVLPTQPPGTVISHSKIVLIWITQILNTPCL